MRWNALLGTLVLAAVSLSAWAPSVTAQTPVPDDAILAFNYELSDPLVDVSLSPGSDNNIATFTLTITDISLDRTQDASGNTQHRYRILGEDARSPNLVVRTIDGAVADGWVADQPRPIQFTMTSGESREVTIRLLPSAQTTVGFVFAKGIITMEEVGTGTFETQQNFTLAARVMPEAAINFIGKFGDVPNQVSPGQQVTFPFELRNPTFYNNDYLITVGVPGDSPLDASRLGISGAGKYTLAPFETRIVNITIVAPQEDFWYYSESYGLTVRAEVVGDESVFIETSAPFIVNGFNWQPSLLILILILIIVVVLVILFFLLARKHYQERILGKPIPPWKIPAEKQHLSTLRKENPRRFYVVRYFLMEEEYQSALLWFHHYKKRSKKQIKQAAKVAKAQDKAEKLEGFTGDKYDRKAERWRKWYAWRRDRVKKKRDRKIARLERKLEKRHEKDFEKDHKKWEKKVEKKTKKANKPILKARKKWEKERDKKLDAWEKEVADLQTDHEKKVDKLRKKFEKQVKKQDKDAWKDWKAQMAEVQAENKVREKEGRDPLPLPELKSDQVDAPDYPADPDLPAKPKLPPEPKLKEPEDLPPEPTLEKPTLRDSKYAKKVRKIEAKAEKKLKKLDRKEAKRLAKIERKRAAKAAKKARKRNEYVAEAEEGYQPSLLERAFRLTPEDHERRARKNLVKALHEDELSHFQEAEENRLDRMRANSKRQEAELEAKLIREKAHVRTAAAQAGKEVTPAQEQEIEKLEGKLEELKRKNTEELQKAKEDSARRIDEESDRIQREIEQREGLPDKESSKGTPSGKSGKS